MRLRLVLFVAAAAVVVVGGVGLVFAARDGSNDGIVPATSPSVEPTAPLDPNTSTATTVATTDGDEITTSAPPIDVDTEPVIIEYPSLPASITERWATTIDGGPMSAVRIDDVIVFGQVDLPGVKAVDARSGEFLWSVDFDDADIIRSLVIIDGQVVVNKLDASGTIAIVLDTSGNVVQEVPGGHGFPGAVVHIVNAETGNRVERIGADGSVVRSVDLGGMLPFGEPQFEVRDESGSTWYDFPSLERIVGPLTVGLDANDRAKPGDVVRAYRLVSGEIVELWSRPGAG